MCDHPEHNHTVPSKQLYIEATSVGALLVPMWWLVSKATTAMRFKGDSKPFLDIFVSGFLFHIAAEETGLNEWYLYNSFAALKKIHPREKDDLLSVVARIYRSGAYDYQGQFSVYGHKDAYRGY